MFAIEMDDVMVVLEECIFAVHPRVMDAEHTPHTFLFRGRDAIKLMLFLSDRTLMAISMTKITSNFTFADAG